MLCKYVGVVGVGCHQSWRFVGRHSQLYDTSPMIPNWPWPWPCWNCTGSYKFSVSIKKMGEGWTGGASDIVKAKSSGEDPRATGGLLSSLPHPRVNKTKQHTIKVFDKVQGGAPLAEVPKLDGKYELRFDQSERRGYDRPQDLVCTLLHITIILTYQSLCGAVDLCVVLLIFVWCSWSLWHLTCLRVWRPLICSRALWVPVECASCCRSPSRRCLSRLLSVITKIGFWNKIFNCLVQESLWHSNRPPDSCKNI